MAGATATDLIVVGGGVSGVAVAIGAARAGLKVTLLERQPRLGGRARSWLDPTTKDPVHIGPHIIYDPDYVNFYKLVEQLGSAGKIKWQSKPNGHFMTWVDGEELTHMSASPSLPAPFNWFPSLLKDKHISFMDIHSMVPVVAFVLNASEKDLMALDNESGAECLRRFGVSEPAIYHFWAFVCHALCNVPVEEVSATALMRFFQRFIGTQKPVRMGFADGGLGEFMEPATEILGSLGSEVRLRTQVVSLTGTADRVEGVVLSNGEELSARVGVVVTLPPPELQILLGQKLPSSHTLFADLALFKPSAYVCTYMWFDRKVTDMQFWSRTWDDMKSLNCDWYDFSNIVTGWEDRPSYIGTNCIDTGVDGRNANKLEDEELFQRALAELRENLPAAREAKVVHWTINRVPLAIHRPVVGTESRRPQPGPIEGIEGLFLSGDVCATHSVFPYCMENAAKSGFGCAEKVLEAAVQAGLPVRAEEIVVPYQPVGATTAAWMIGSAVDFAGKVGSLFGAGPQSKL